MSFLAIAAAADRPARPPVRSLRAAVSRARADYLPIRFTRESPLLASGQACADPMFIKLTRSRDRTCAQLVESFRDDTGRPRQRTMATLGRIDEAGGQVDALLGGLLRAKGRSPDEGSPPQVRFESAFALGDFWALRDHAARRYPITRSAACWQRLRPGLLAKARSRPSRSRLGQASYLSPLLLVARLGQDLLAFLGARGWLGWEPAGAMSARGNCPKWSARARVIRRQMRDMKPPRAGNSTPDGSDEFTPLAGV